MCNMSSEAGVQGHKGQDASLGFVGFFRGSKGPVSIAPHGVTRLSEKNFYEDTRGTIGLCRVHRGLQGTTKHGAKWSYRAIRSTSTRATRARESPIQVNLVL